MTKSVGIIQVPINAFDFPSSVGRELHGPTVKKLTRLFERVRCRPKKWEHHVKGRISYGIYWKILTALGLTRQQLQETAKRGVKYRKVLLPPKSIVCLQGKHRLAAANKNDDLINVQTGGFLHETEQSAGNIYWILRCYNYQCSKNSDPPWTQLSPSKEKNLNMLTRVITAEGKAQYKHQKILNALDSVVSIPALRDGMLLGNWHKILKLCCPEPVIHYINRIYEQWANIARDVRDFRVDAQDVQRLEYLAPSLPDDREKIRYMMKDYEIFRNVNDPVSRKKILRNILSINGIITSQKTFHTNMSYLEIALEVLSQHIMGDERVKQKTLFENLAAYWDNGKAFVEYEEGRFHRLVTTNFVTAAVQLVLFVLRHFPYLSNVQPLQDKRGARAVVAEVDEYYLYLLYTLANNLGFSTSKVRHGITQRRKPPGPRKYTVNSFHPEWRGGKPRMWAFVDLQSSSFLPTLLNAPKDEETPLFVQADFIEAFFGRISYNIEESAASSPPTSPGPSFHTDSADLERSQPDVLDSEYLTARDSLSSKTTPQDQVFYPDLSSHKIFREAPQTPPTTIQPNDRWSPIMERSQNQRPDNPLPSTSQVERSSPRTGTPQGRTEANRRNDMAPHGPPLTPPVAKTAIQETLPYGPPDTPVAQDTGSRLNQSCNPHRPPMSPTVPEAFIQQLTQSQGGACQTQQITKLDQNPERVSYDPPTAPPASESLRTLPSQNEERLPHGPPIAPAVEISSQPTEGQERLPYNPPVTPAFEVHLNQGRRPHGPPATPTTAKATVHKRVPHLPPITPTGPQPSPQKKAPRRPSIARSTAKTISSHGDRELEEAQRQPLPPSMPSSTSHSPDRDLEEARRQPLPPSMPPSTSHSPDRDTYSSASDSPRSSTYDPMYQSKPLYTIPPLQITPLKRPSPEIDSPNKRSRYNDSNEQLQTIFGEGESSAIGRNLTARRNVKAKQRRPRGIRSGRIREFRYLQEGIWSRYFEQTTTVPKVLPIESFLREQQDVFLTTSNSPQEFVPDDLFLDNQKRIFSRFQQVVPGPEIEMPDRPSLSEEFPVSDQALPTPMEKFPAEEQEVQMSDRPSLMKEFQAGPDLGELPDRPSSREEFLALQEKLFEKYPSQRPKLLGQLKRLSDSSDSSATELQTSRGSTDPWAYREPQRKR